MKILETEFFLSKGKEFIIIILIIIITASFYFPIIKGIPKTLINENDWWRNYYYAGLARKTVIQYREFPFRTPFMSGGYPFIAHPSGFSLSPLFLFILFFDEITGLRIMIFLIFIISALGMFYLTRNVLKYNLLGSIFSSLAFILCNWGAYEVVDGNLQKTLFYLLPWILAFLKKSEKDAKYFIFTIFVLSLVILQSSIEFMPIFLFLLAYTFLDSFEIKKIFKIKVNIFLWVNFLLVIVLSLLFCAVKIIPLLQLYLTKVSLQYKGTYFETVSAIRAYNSALTLNKLKASLLDSSFHGYSVMYFGYIPIIIFIFSLILFKKKSLLYFFLFLIFIIIQFGPNSYINLFKTWWHLRLFFPHSLWRLDKYFGFFPSFLIPLVGGRIFLFFEGRKKILQTFAFLVILYSISNMYLHNRLVFKGLIYEKIPIFKKYDSFFQVEIEKIEIERNWPGYSEVKDIRSYQPFWILLNQNIGITNFILKGIINIGEYTIPKYILKTGELKGECIFVKGFENLSKFKTVDLISAGEPNPSYRGEVFLLNEKNKAILSHFSPNKIDIDVIINMPDTLTINQNYHKSWRPDKGKLMNYKGLLAIKLSDKGTYKVKVRYMPLDFYIGLFISILSLLGMASYLMHSFK